MYDNYTCESCYDIIHLNFCELALHFYQSLVNCFSPKMVCVCMQSDK